MSVSFLDRFRPRSAASVPDLAHGPAQLRAYWEGLRQGGGLPQRSALDPRGLDGVLDRVFLAERIARGLVQVRLAGSGLAEIAGMDLRGLPLSCLFSAEARPQLAEALEGVATGDRIAALELASDRGTGRSVGQMLLLPLADGAGRGLVLGCLGTVGVLPTGKFVILRRQDERLDLPAPEPARPAPPPLRTRGHLSLVHARD